MIFILIYEAILLGAACRIYFIIQDVAMETREASVGEVVLSGAVCACVHARHFSLNSLCIQSCTLLLAI